MLPIITCTLKVPVEIWSTTSVVSFQEKYKEYAHIYASLH